MKHLITILATFIISMGFAQDKIGKAEWTSTGGTKIEKVAMEVTIDSLEELESTFQKENIEKLFDDFGIIDDITFKLTCNAKEKTHGINSNVSYEVKGNSGEKDVFLAQVEIIKKAARSFYNK